MPQLKEPFAAAETDDRLHVDTVCIPCDGSRPTVANFFVTGAGTTEIPLDKCNEGEKSLLAFPQVWACEKSTRTFSWEHRSLTSLFAEDIGRYNREWRGDYWMYTCRDKKAGLPRNKYLEKISDTTVYGDAYVFNVLHYQESDGSYRWKFGDLGADFIYAADHGQFPRIILRKLLTALSKQVN